MQEVDVSVEEVEGVEDVGDYIDVDVTMDNSFEYDSPY